MTATEVHFNADLQALVGTDGRVLPLRPQTSDVLRLLVSNIGRITSKDEIIEVVWGAKAFSDDSVYQCISEIRRAIGNIGSSKIRTVSRRGYVIEDSLIIHIFTAADHY